MTHPFSKGRSITRGPPPLRRMGVDVLPHGFRSSFRDWCIDNGKDSELAEFCLAHVVGDAAAEWSSF